MNLILNELNGNISDAIGIFDEDEIAIYMLSFAEGTDILRTASPFSNLNLVKWFGSSAYSKNNTLLTDAVAADFAIERELLCPIFGYDEMARDLWEPLAQKLNLSLGRKPEIYALNAYDAMWLFTNAHLKAEQVDGSQNEFANLRTAFINEANGHFGVTGRTTLNAAGDREFAFYDFWKIVKDGNDYEWEFTAKYNNTSGELNWE